MLPPPAWPQDLGSITGTMGFGYDSTAKSQLQRVYASGYPGDSSVYVSGCAVRSVRVAAFVWIVCVCVCVCARVHVRVRACVCLCVRSTRCCILLCAVI